LERTFKDDSNGVTSAYATMVHGQGCNPHHCTTTFVNVKLCHYDVITRKL